MTKGKGSVKTTFLYLFLAQKFKDSTLIVIFTFPRSNGMDTFWTTFVYYEILENARFQTRQTFRHKLVWVEVLESLQVSPLMIGSSAWRVELTQYVVVKSLQKQILLDTTYLHALNLEFHVVFSGGFTIFPFLPTVSITSITHFLSRIEEHGTTFGSEKKHEV